MRVELFPPGSVRSPSAMTRGLAGIDVFRLEEGKIVEHRDAPPPVPEKAANENTMF